GDPEIVRFTRVPAPYQRSDAEAFIVEAQELLASGSEWSLVIANPKTDALLGTVLLGIQGPGVAEVGYWVRREARGRGYATRATRLVSESGIHELALSRIQLHAFPENVASQR